MMPAYDYQPTAAPAQLAEHADLVIVGEVVEADATTDGLGIELRDVTRVVGTELPDAGMRVIVDQMATETATGRTPSCSKSTRYSDSTTG